MRGPALALYAESFFQMDVAAPDAMRLSHTWEDRVMAAFRLASIERLKRELSHVVVREFPNTAHMSILALAKDAVTAAIRDFLGHAGQQRVWSGCGPTTRLQPAGAGVMIARG